MKKSEQRSRAAAPPARTAMKGSATDQVASPASIQHDPGAQRKRLPVPIEDALQRVSPDTQLSALMWCLANTPQFQFVSMPTLSQCSGSLNVHSGMASIRRRF